MLAQGLQSVGHTGAPQLHQGEITRELLDRVGARNEGPVVKWTQSGRDKPVSCPRGVVAIEGDNVLWICLCMCEARQTFTLCEHVVQAISTARPCLVLCS